MDTKTHLHHTLIFFLLILLITSCNIGWFQTFPETDIVYQTGSFEEPKLGFVNADGSGNIILNVPKYLIKPIWGQNRNQLFGITKRISLLSGYPFYWRERAWINICKDWWEVDQVEGVIEITNAKHLLVNQSTKAINLIDYESCKLIKTLVSVDKPNSYIFGLSLSPDKSSFLYSVVEDNYTSNPSFIIYQQSLTSNQIMTLGTGIYPSWSPDSSYIAYVNLDGIYRMKSNGTQIRKLIDIDFSTKQDQIRFREIIAIPQWSPDSEWLVYHRCFDTCVGDEEFSIVKVNVNTGIEEVVVHGGIYPDWFVP